MQRSGSKRRGFTLIELLLLMLIIAIIAAIAAPTLSGFGRGRRLENATNQLVAVARWARTRAISDGLVYRLNFDMSARKYWLSMQLDDGSGQFGYVPEEFGRDFTLPDDINIAANLVMQPDGMYVEFQPNGRTDPVTIQLTDTQYNDSNDIGTLTATELFHVFSDSERAMVQQ